MTAEAGKEALPRGAPDPCFLGVGQGVVHPWLCDAMGHLTTRHYLGFFDDASYHLFASFGYDPRKAEQEGWGWADVRQEIDYHCELGVGALVTVEGRVVAVGRSSLQLEYRMHDRFRDRLSATLKARTVCFDLRARRSRTVPDELRTEIATLFGVG